jgi:hypothetical protein
VIPIIKDIYLYIYERMMVVIIKEDVDVLPCPGSWRISDWLWKKGKEGRQKFMELRGDFSLSINKV